MRQEISHTHIWKKKKEYCFKVHHTPKSVFYSGHDKFSKLNFINSMWVWMKTQLPVIAF